MTNVTALPDRPTPPKGLPAVARDLWRRIVLDYPPKHFNAANLVLLEGFCRAWAHALECDKAVEQHGVLVDGKANPAAALRTAAWKELRAFAGKLRLPISSLQRADSAKARPDERNALPKPWDRA